MMSWRQVTAAQPMPSTAATLTTQPASTAGPPAPLAFGRLNDAANGPGDENICVSAAMGLGWEKGKGLAGGCSVGFAAG